MANNDKKEPALRSRKAGKPIGNTGTEHYNGYFSEEFNPKWRDSQRVEIVEEMRRGDAAIKGVLNAVKTPMLSADFFIEGGEEEHEEFAREQTIESKTMSFPQTLREQLTYLDFGHSVFEKIKYINQKGLVGLMRLAPRIQSSIQNWELSDGSPGIQQYVRNDEKSSEENRKWVFEIPVSKLMIFTNEQEGADVTGQSILRSAYKHWKFKDGTYRVQAIGIERTSVGIPVATMPDSAGTQERDEMEDILENLRVNEEQNIVLPSPEYKIEFLTVDSNAMGNSIESFINHHNRMIMMSVLANFLDLGSGETGSFALSKDQSSFFLKHVEQHLKYVCEVWNCLIKELIDMNWSNVKEYPKLKFQKLGEIDYKEMSDVMSALANAGYVNPMDKNIQTFLRSTFKLPEQEEEEMEKEEKKENKTPVEKDDDDKKEKEKEQSLGGDCGCHYLAESKKKRFWRELNDFEKNIELKFLDEKTDELQNALETKLANEIKPALDRASTRAKNLIKAGNINALIGLDIISKDKLAKDIRQETINAFEVGKKTAAKELDVDRPKMSAKTLAAIKFDAMQQADTIKSEVEKTFKENIKNGIQNNVPSDATIASAMNEARDKAATKIHQAKTSIIGDYIGRGRYDVFQQHIADISGFVRTEVLDSKTCEMCLSLDGRIIKADDPYRRLTKVHSNCFLAGTKVLLKNGEEKNIEDVKIYDFVATHKDNYKTVYHTLGRHYEGDVIEIELENGKVIKCTPDHEFWVDDEWVAAEKLANNSILSESALLNAQ